MKAKAFLILIIFLIALSSCKSEHKRLLKSTALLNFPDTVEYIPSVEEANVLEAAETICWVNHYYNRGIYEKDGYTWISYKAYSGKTCSVAVGDTKTVQYGWAD